MLSILRRNTTSMNQSHDQRLIWVAGSVEVMFRVLQLRELTGKSRLADSGIPGAFFRLYSPRPRMFEEQPGTEKSTALARRVSARSIGDHPYKN